MVAIRVKKRVRVMVEVVRDLFSCVGGVVCCTAERALLWCLKKKNQQ